MPKSRIAEAYVQLVPSFADFGKTIQKTMRDLPIGNEVTKNIVDPLSKGGDQAGKGFAGGFSKAMKAGLVGLAAVASAGLVKDMVGSINSAVNKASDLEQAQGAVSEVFGPAAQQMEDFAKTADQAYGLSSRAALDAAKNFGIFGTSAGLTSEELIPFSQDLIALSADLSAFGNTTPEEALNALSAGLRGESEPLRKYGILLDDATLKARAMEMGIFSGTGTLTQQQRILAAQNEIMAQSSTQMGQFARESDGLAGQQAIFAAQMENVSAELGKVFMPLWVNFYKFLNDTGIPVLKVAVGVLGSLFSGEGFDAEALGLDGMAAGFANVLGPAAQLMATLSPLGLIMQALIQAGPQILEALAPLGEVFMTTIIPAVGELLAALTPVLAAVIELAANVISNLVPVLVMLVQIIVPIITMLANLLAPILMVVAEILGAVLPPIITVLGGIFQAVFSFIAKVLYGWALLFTVVVNTLINAANALGAGFPLIPMPEDPTSMPMLATGANIMPSKGGTAAILGEGGRAETVTDLGKTNQMIENSNRLASQALAGGGAGGGTNIKNEITIVQQPGESAEAIVRKLEEFWVLNSLKPAGYEGVA